MLYTTSLVLIDITYLTAVSLYLLTAFFHFPLAAPFPTSGDHKSDLFFYEFVKFLSIVFFFLIFFYSFIEIVQHCFVKSKS